MSDFIDFIGQMNAREVKYDMICENIGENIRSLRNRQGKCSAVKVVDRINALGYEVSLDTYYKWERGVRQPPSDAIPFLAKVFGVSETTIFHLKETESRRTDAFDLFIKEESQNLSKEAKQLFIWLIAKWSGTIEKVLLFFGMYTGLDKKDQEIVKTLLKRFYDEKRTQGTELAILMKELENK